LVKGFSVLKFDSYSLTPQEEGLVARIGYERQLPYLGRPEMNRNYSEGDIWEMWQHAIAAGSELAFARMCGLDDFEPHVNKWKTQEDVPGYEVRYSFKATGIRLSEWDAEDATYVLIVGGPQHKTRRVKENNWLSPPYQALGWASGIEIKECGDYNGKSWHLDVSKINKINLQERRKRAT
jgi:hypothetical protein